VEKRRILGWTANLAHSCKYTPTFMSGNNRLSPQLRVYLQLHTHRVKNSTFSLVVFYCATTSLKFNVDFSKVKM